MASTIKIKRSSTSGSVPSSLAVGEIAVNLFDRKLYVGNSAGVTAIGGEDFRLTTDGSAGEGAYLKLLGDSVLSTNNVLLRGGTGITVAADGNGSISFTSTLGGDIDAKASWSALIATNTAIRTLVGNNLANTNAYIATNAATELSHLANTNAYIATKLNSSSYTAADVLTKIKTVDGAASGLDADLLDGQQGSYYAVEATEQARLANTNAYIATESGRIDLVNTNLTGTNTAIRTLVNDRLQVANAAATYQTITVERAALANTNARIAATEANIAQKLGAGASVTLTGDVTGTATFSSNSVSIATTYNNDVVLGTDTSGNYAAAVTGTTNEVEVTGSAGEGTTFQVGLPNDVTIGNNLTITNDASVGGDLTVSGGLTVTGALTYLSTSTVYTDDGMMKLSANNAGDATDTGIYGKYIDGATTKYAGYFRDATDGIFKFYTGNQSEPTSTVDTAATGYALAQLDAVIDGGTY